MVRLIDYEDLEVCDLCEDYICMFHQVHFEECDCQLKIWAEANEALD